MLSPTLYQIVCITIKHYSIKGILVLVFALISIFSFGQNCSVNAGFDQSFCYANNMAASINAVNNLFTLSGNSAGNVNAITNLKWELVSAPVGANITLTTPTLNNTTATATYSQAPSGVYLYRLGMDCQNGIRAFDTVKITIKNVANFEMFANSKWSDVCGDVEQQIKLTARPLKAGEQLYIYGSSLALVSSNVNTALFTNYLGPTFDSVRITIKNISTALCTTSQGPLFRYNISDGSCVANGKEPISGDLNSVIGYVKPKIIKAGSKKTDTLICIDNVPSITKLMENMCVIGGIAGLQNYLANPLNFSIIKLSGSGSIIPYYSTASTSLYNYQYLNNFDTLSPNTLHTFELTYNSNGCFTSFKDTIKIFFVSVAPGIKTFRFTNQSNNSTVNYCITEPFPLTSFKYPLILSGTIPAHYSFNSKIINKPSFSTATITNPSSKDTLFITGTLRAGTYGIRTTITNTINGCVTLYVSNITLTSPIVLPPLRDTIICSNASIEIRYPANSFGFGQYFGEKISGPGAIECFISSDLISIGFAAGSSVIPGNYSIRVYANTSIGLSCNDGRSDTFNITILSKGFDSNAGTNQQLLCNINSTNLAGSQPNTSGGAAGFWKFLPAISSNAGAPIVISNSASTNPNITGFLNLSTYYFSWNVTEGNTGNYCNLKPDTVFIIYSGIPPTSAQGAQHDFTGCLPLNGIYNLTSNAVTPTFNVTWRKLTGGVVTIANANAQNTDLLNLSAGNYSFEITLQNSCGTFKDTVNLSFTNCPLSVQLLSFSGQNIANNNFIKWQVTKEMNLEKYILEVSGNGSDFEFLTEINYNNNSALIKNYFYNHLNVVRNLNYYRLKSVNNDGSFSYSQILKLHTHNAAIQKLEVYPIPAKTQITINYNAIENGKTNLILKNSVGQIVLKKAIELWKGENSFGINLEALARGMYVLEIDSATKKILLQ